MFWLYFGIMGLYPLFPENVEIDKGCKAMALRLLSQNGAAHHRSIEKSGYIGYNA